MMKVVAFTPSRLNSQRIPGKNIKTLGKTHLVNYALRVMNVVKSIDEVVMFATEPSICDYITEGINYRYLKRPGFLDTQEAKVQDLIREFLKLDNADIVVMFHITSPFLKPETVAECVDKVKSGEYETAFTAFQVDQRCWFKGRPLNYNIKNGHNPTTKPVIVEHSLYVFKRSVFETTTQRISSNPYIKIVDIVEGHDIDTPEDFKVAELIVNTGLLDLD
ncbi:MAG: acylneuraminate cytidylyltransferase family protein [Candidatus Brocadiaceae bacterium]|nr:acylneuraminate cytidylyltransferase family protein [Candidatus Brocadiaceae bacterium]